MTCRIWHIRLSYLVIAPDVRGYLHHIFLISPWKHKLWVLIRILAEAILMNTHNGMTCRIWHIRLSYLVIAPDVRGYLHHIFLISPWKHKLWVLIRILAEAILMNTHNGMTCRIWHIRLSYLVIAPDVRGYLHHIFLISPWKHKLWVLIRILAEAILMNTHNVICVETRKISVLWVEKRALSGAIASVQLNLALRL